MISNWLQDQYLKTIVLFQVPDGKGSYRAHGTGVLMLYKNVFFLATCKHVVLKNDGTAHQGLIATINKKDGTTSNKNIEAIQKRFGLKWFFHANDKVDLALSPIAIEQAVEDVIFIPEDQLENFDDMPLGDEIFFLGYPLGLGVRDVPKISPLVRTGIIALKKIDKTFLIDANVYPGSSGSPAFYRPVLATLNGGKIALGGSRPMRFLGIVNANIPSVEQAVSLMTGRIRTVFEENAGLGIVQSASLLLEIFNYPEVQALIPKTQEAQVEAKKDPKDEEVKEVKDEEPK